MENYVPSIKLFIVPPKKMSTGLLTHQAKQIRWKINTPEINTKHEDTSSLEIVVSFWVEKGPFNNFLWQDKFKTTQGDAKQINLIQKPMQGS